MSEDINYLSDTYAFTLNKKHNKIVECKFPKTILRDLLDAAGDVESAGRILEFVTDNIGTFVADAGDFPSIKKQSGVIYSNVRDVIDYVKKNKDKNGIDISELELKFVVVPRKLKDDSLDDQHKKDFLESLVNPYKDD